MPRSNVLALGLAMSIAATVAACNGCKGGPATKDGGAPSSTAPTAGAKPTLRLYLLSTVAGAIEPCGCSKNQLGGIDRLATLVAKREGEAPYATASVGPLFFLDPEPRKDQKTQDEWKAEAMADALKALRLAAFAPGENDFGSGEALLKALRDRSGADLVLSNVGGPNAGAVTTSLREIAGHKIAFVGVYAPRNKPAPFGLTVSPVKPALEKAVADAKAKGAEAVVGLFAMHRGEALRLVETVPGLTVAAVGKPEARGDLNDKPTDAVVVEKTLVVETANHLQTVATVDLYLRGPGTIEPVATGEAPLTGNAARAGMLPVTSDVEKSMAMSGVLTGYYKRVNEHNQKAFAGREPPRVGAGETGYVGVEACGKCHEAALAVWKKTAHAHAYKTLSDQSKEFNLDCVSCHVTGYEKPGGSTVTQNDKLRDVQCEVCHGPGERHAKSPREKNALVAKPKADDCVTACHHPPHVEGFDAAAKMPLVLGPGHGMR